MSSNVTPHLVRHRYVVCWPNIFEHTSLAGSPHKPIACEALLVGRRVLMLWRELGQNCAPHSHTTSRCHSQPRDRLQPSNVVSFPSPLSWYTPAPALIYTHMYALCAFRSHTVRVCLLCFAGCAPANTTDSRRWTRGGHAPAVAEVAAYGHRRSWHRPHCP